MSSAEKFDRAALEVSYLHIQFFILFWDLTCPLSLATCRQAILLRSLFPNLRRYIFQLYHSTILFSRLFSIGVAGLYDYGPSGCALLNNIISVWRNHFVLEEEMLEVDTSIMTTYDVLKTSGHVDKFADYMCKDLKNGEIFRADHVIEAVLEARLQGDKEAKAAKAGKSAEEIAAEAAEAAAAKADKKKKKKKGVVVAVELADDVRQTYEETLAQIDNYNGEELAAIMKKFDIRSPETGNELSEPKEFNLMFESSIGPTGHLKG